MGDVGGEVHGMTTKQYLSRYLDINREINALVEDCARLRSLAEKVGCGQLSDMPKCGNADPSAPFTRAIEQIVAKETEINQRIDEMMVVRDEIEDAIVKVPNNTSRVLLRYRYICGWTWERIAVELHYSWRQTIRLHGEALKLVIVS
jgi:hypothetical protein